MPGTVVQSGTYTLELDTGFMVDAFTLNDATKGVLNNTEYVLNGTTQFADITEYVTSIYYTRGRQKTDYQFGAGTMTFEMRDQTGILGPYDTSSIYYDPGNDQPGLAPMRQVRLFRGTQALFTGVVTSYEYTFAMAGPNTVTVQCADEFYRLAQTQLDAWNVTAQTSGERITSALALPEVDYTGSTSIATGTVNLGHSADYDVAAGTNTLYYLQQINDAEQGRLFVANDGTITFQERIGNTLSGPVISFIDDAGGAKYDDLSVEFDADNVVNRAYVEALNGNNATDTDAGSIAQYFTQSVTKADSLLHIQGEIDALAAYLLEPDPEPRYTSVHTFFGLLTDPQRASVASIDIGDTISIHKVIPGLNTALAEESAVEGISASITVNGGHRIRFYTSPTTIVYELILDDATYGQMDSTNVLG